MHMLICVRGNRSDLKTALQAKDRDRLAVLRAVLTKVLNASKTPKPVTTDVQVLALLRQSARAGRTAATEFRDAGRRDLAEKEDRQVDIMEEYAACVETVGEEAIAVAVKDVVHKMRGEGSRAMMGDVLRRVMAPDALGKRPVEQGKVVNIVKQILAEP